MNVFKKPVVYAVVIALLTDFGTKDYFVAAMKGVILSINPNAVVVDITHEVPPQDVWTGAFVLKSVYKWFPRGTIFVAVVDPGVGTERAPLLLQTRNYFFVGPDNGVLSLAAQEDGVVAAYRIEARLPRVSRTFHGRDVFAPAAAYLSLGISPSMSLRSKSGSLLLAARSISTTSACAAPQRPYSQHTSLTGRPFDLQYASFSSGLANMRGLILVRSRPRPSTLGKILKFHWWFCPAKFLK